MRPAARGLTAAPVRTVHTPRVPTRPPPGPRGRGLRGRVGGRRPPGRREMARGRWPRSQRTGPSASSKSQRLRRQNPAHGQDREDSGGGPAPARRPSPVLPRPAALQRRLPKHPPPLLRGPEPRAVCQPTGRGSCPPASSARLFLPGLCTVAVAGGCPPSCRVLHSPALPLVTAGLCPGGPVLCRPGRRPPSSGPRGPTRQQQGRRPGPRPSGIFQIIPTCFPSPLTSTRAQPYAP